MSLMASRRRRKSVCMDGRCVCVCVEEEDFRVSQERGEGEVGFFPLKFSVRDGHTRVVARSAWIFN